MRSCTSHHWPFKLEVGPMFWVTGAILSLALALLNADSAIGNELYVYDVNVQRTYNFIPVFFSDDRDAIVGNYTGVPLVSQYASPELMNNALVFVNQWTPPLETVVEVTLSVPGRVLILTRGRPVSAFDGVPCLNIIEPDVSDLKALFEEDPTRILYANFTIKGNEHNPWDRSKITLHGQVALSLMSAIGFGIAAWRFTLFFRARLFNVGFVCTILLMVSLLLKFAFVTVDPWGFNLILSFGARSFLSSFHLPWGLSCALLVALFWHETLIKDGLAVSAFLGKMRVPFFIIVAIMFGLEILFTTMRIHGYTWVAINNVVYVVLAFALAVFYVVSGIRILRALNKGMGNMRTRSRHEHRKRAACLIASVIGYYFFLFGAALMNTRELGYEGKPAGYSVTVGMYCGGTIIADIALAIAITPPSKEAISSQSRSNNSNKKAKSTTGSSHV